MTLLLAGGAALALYVLLRRAGPIDLPRVRSEVRARGPLSLNRRQRSMETLIGYHFGRAGLSWLTDAAVVNAWHESALDPNAIGDSGLSVGLFQLHERGAGAGLSVEARQDPDANILRIIQEAEQRGASAQRGRSNAELTVWFANQVERCWECGYGGGDAQLFERAVTFGRLYGLDRLSEVP